VVISDHNLPSAAMLLNIKNARKHFENIEKVQQQQAVAAQQSISSGGGSRILR